MLKIINIVENISNRSNLEKEHGLCLYIENDDEIYLLDTGDSNIFLKNAKELNIDLLRVEKVVISHNHDDHTGGIVDFLEYNNDAKVIVKNEFKGQFYSEYNKRKIKISIDDSFYKLYNNRIIYFDKSLKLSNTVSLHSNIIYNNEFFCKDKSLFEKHDNMLIPFVPDKFDHELFMVIQRNNKLIVISSCSHNGIVNIIESVKKIYGNKVISHVIGGFHLMGFEDTILNCSKEYVINTAHILNDVCKCKIYTCHCTGMFAFEIMQDEIGDKVEYFSTGMEINIE